MKENFGYITVSVTSQKNNSIWFYLLKLILKFALAKINL